MSTTQLDIEYITTISTSLSLFKWRRQGKVAACRCLICGDSKKDPTKTRLFFFEDDDGTGFQYHCKNCGASGSLWYFLKEYFPDKYQQYKFEKMRRDGRTYAQKADRIKSIPLELEEEKPPVIAPQKPVETLLTLDKISRDHPAVQYALGRGIPERALQRIVFAPNFQEWCDEHIGETEGFVRPDPRLVFVMRKANGEIFGAQGRVFYPIEERYRFCTAKKENENHFKVFGLETVNTTLPLFSVEGVVDSLFVPNCIAMAGGDPAPEVIGTCPGQDHYWVGDNEPRAKDTVHRMQKAIDFGFKVCFWNIGTQYKDINDMVHKGGYTPKSIVEHIIKNSYSGARAKLAMSKWAKI